MSNPEIKFVVSTPCNLNNQPSGYRIIQLKNRKLSSLPINSNKILPNNNNITDIGITTQAFCYLKPYDKNILPESQNVGIMDYSDYMVLSKSNGLIEIIKDYQYKIHHNLPLVPDYVLACLPDGFTSHTTHSGVTIGLEFKDGLLYCCQSNGDIYVFILNLPAYYIQSNNLFDLNIQYNNNNQNTPDSTISNETYIQDSEDLQARQISDFFKETQYTGRTKLKHICYYLTPLQLDTTQSTKQNTLLHYITLYKDQYIYRPSICITLNHGISHFHINPFDRLSFLIGSQFDPIIIRKIVLPMTYLNYLITYLNLKKRVQEKYQMEIIPWEEVAMENGFHSFAVWIAYESVYGYETASKTLWDGIRNDGGTGYLQSIVVWRQGSDHSTGVRVGNERYSDTLQPSLATSSDSIVSRTSMSSDNNTSGSRGRRWRRRRRGRGRRDNFDLVRGNTIPRNGDRYRPEILQSFSNRRFSPFSKKMQVNKTLADFSVVDTNSLDNNTFKKPFFFQNKSHPSNYDDNIVDSYSDAPDIPSSPQSSSNSHNNNNNNSNHEVNFHNVGTQFLTDKYKTMEILRIDKSLCFSVLKPKFQNNEITKIDFFYNKRKMDNISTVSMNNNNNNNEEETYQEENIRRVILGKTLPNLSSFKKIFRLTKTLCLIVDNSGLLLIDLNNIGKGVHNLNDMKEIDCLLSKRNTTNDLPIRVSIFDIGLVNDAIVVMESFDLEPNRHIMRLNVITTCLPGDIKAFEVEFDSNHIMGYTVLQDCLRLTDVNRFTDKMALLDCNVGPKFRNKRAFSDDLLSDREGFKTKIDGDPSVQDKRIKLNRRNSHP